MKAQPITFFLPDTRGVEISRFGRGNKKIGMDVYTYSRVAGNPALCSTTHHDLGFAPLSLNPGGTCPGSTPECEAICYAKRITGPVRQNYLRNAGDDVPELPADCRLLRIHVSGDFDTWPYIQAWVRRLAERPDVRAWAYTRSWRVADLLPDLEILRGLPNVQLFASMDPTTRDLPPIGWRRAWIDRTWDKAIERGVERPLETRLMGGLFGRPTLTSAQSAFEGGILGTHCDSADNTLVIADGTPSYVCPEETGRKPDCQSCRYCFDGQRNDVTFLEH